MPRQGPDLSEKGQQLFETLRGNQPDTVGCLLKLKVVNELGVKVASDKGSQFAFALVRKGLEDYVKFNEYDGLENPTVCLSRMIMEEVKQVLEEKGVLTKDTV